MGLERSSRPGGSLVGFTGAMALAMGCGLAACSGPTAVPATTEAVASATPAATRSAFGIVQPGDPVPADVVGLWRDELGDWVWFLPPADPYCSKVVHTTQGCHVFWNDATVAGKPIPWTDVVTTVDGKLRFWSLGDQTCHGKASTVAYEVTATGIDLHLQPGSCFTRVFDLIKPGSNGQPDASAAPTLPVP